MLCPWACSDLGGIAKWFISIQEKKARRKASVNSIKKHYLLTAASYCCDQFPLTFIPKWFTVGLLLLLLCPEPPISSQQVNNNTPTHTYTTAADQRPSLTRKSMSNNLWLIFPVSIVSVRVCTESIILWRFSLMKVSMCLCVCGRVSWRHEWLSVY